MSFFVTSYRSIAEWRAVVARLEGFQVAVDSANQAAVTPPVIEVARANTTNVAVKRLDVHLPTGRPLVAADNINVAPREHVLVNGPSGAGKSTLFRAIAGIWPFGKGSVTIPQGANLMVLPQRPYLPIGSLHAAIAYPAPPDRFDHAAMRDALMAVGLPALVERIDEEAHWNRMLSLGEQQRLGIARAILHQPDYLFLDEATASLDEPSEAALYKLLYERLPGAAIVSIGHRATLNTFHTRRLELAPENGHFNVREAALVKAT